MFLNQEMIFFFNHNFNYQQNFKYLYIYFSLIAKIGKTVQSSRKFFDPRETHRLSIYESPIRVNMHITTQETTNHAIIPRFYYTQVYVYTMYVTRLSLCSYFYTTIVLFRVVTIVLPLFAHVSISA